METISQSECSTLNLIVQNVSIFKFDFSLVDIKAHKSFVNIMYRVPKPSASQRTEHLIGLQGFSITMSDNNVSSLIILLHVYSLLLANVA